jgi:hypothetical protein
MLENWSGIFIPPAFIKIRQRISYYAVGNFWRNTEEKFPLNWNNW